MKKSFLETWIKSLRFRLGDGFTGVVLLDQGVFAFEYRALADALSAVPASDKDSNKDPTPVSETLDL